MSFAIRWKEGASFVGPHAGKRVSEETYDSQAEADMVLQAMANGEHAEVIIVADPPAKDWVLDDAAQARIDAALDAIDRRHADLPTCVVCGQRCNALDVHGTCSKLSTRSEPHRIRREEMAVQR